MRIVVIGGSGLIGSKLIPLLTAQGHEAIAASPNTGVDTLTGEGLAAALEGADVVVDVSNSPSFADDDVLAFFRTSTTNQLAAEQAAGVGHHVALSVVGSERLPDSGYLRAKVAQEELIRGGGIPFTIVRATQFFEFVGAIAAAATVDGVARVAPVLFQPMAARDVARFLADATLAPASDATIEIGGPAAVAMDELVRRGLASAEDPREVVTDPSVGYFGARPDDGELLPGDGARLSTATFDDWLSENVVRV
jgi:uncharacterized protein YbjT (DUF2867 family)